MPTISTFYGVTIRMYWDDHPPPHFHARYRDHRAVIEIDTLGILRGDLPRRALTLILEWALLHRKELADNWSLCARKLPPRRIAPLK
ncbi:MAG TPA: DUF4160 domain-containing protein [Gemmatimonadaceae bacterium]|nr:DUF4160 domain-containing protein [Gemmatimonadaceae bacterium]